VIIPDIVPEKRPTRCEDMDPEKVRSLTRKFGSHLDSEAVVGNGRDALGSSRGAGGVSWVPL